MGTTDILKEHGQATLYLQKGGEVAGYGSPLWLLLQAEAKLYDSVELISAHKLINSAHKPPTLGAVESWEQKQ